jgi:NAD(P)-dependent dehydrogenase (short-subunit alcohol dehydrogenase family)
VIVARLAHELEAALPAAFDGTSAGGAWLTADLANRYKVENLATRSGEFFGPINILVNNAGTNRIAPVERVANAGSPTGSRWDGGDVPKSSSDPFFSSRRTRAARSPARPCR